VGSIALAIVRDLSTSEDVAQAVFLTAWQGLAQLRNPASFS
jgi:DNA-directed RNA polymerase specialized sigma24 family protein